MSQKPNDIEQNIRLVAIVGIILFISLVSSLVFVQVRMGRSQGKLTGMIVPTQREIGALNGSIGSMFRRQSEILSADLESLGKLSDRSGLENSVHHHRQAVTELLNVDELKDVPNYPAESLEALGADARDFFEADTKLYETALRYRVLEKEFAGRVNLVDQDLRKLMEASGGVAGVLRLEHMSMLRRIDSQFKNGEFDEDAVRQTVTGDTRVQLAAMNDLDAAVLRLGVLAGKVGIAANRDQLNSLVANELSQNANKIQRTIARIKKIVSVKEAIDRVSELQALANQLSSQVSNEAQPNSLASLRRRVLSEQLRVREIQDEAASAARHLDAHTRDIREFTESVAASARESSLATVSMSRTMTAIVSLLGLMMAFVAGIRVRKSVTGLRAQNQQLVEMSDDLAKINASLEHTVTQRTASLQMVLDSTGEGLLSVDLDGTLLPERSAAITQWFGVPKKDVTLWDYLAPNNESLRDSLNMNFDQIASEVFPFEVAVDMMPEQIQRGKQTYSLDFREVLEDGSLSKVLILVNDITAKLEAEQAERESRQLHQVIGSILRDRRGFQEMIDECTALIRSLESADNVSQHGLVLTKRTLHTIKGNTALMGFTEFADHVHSLEDQYTDDVDGLPDSHDFLALQTRWKQAVSTVDQYLKTDQNEGVQIHEEEFDEFMALATMRDTIEDAIAMAQDWKYDSSATPLRRLADKASYVADATGKSVRISVEHHFLRLPSDNLRSFWASMVHVVRNAVDHGLETPDERIDHKKPTEGHLSLATMHNGPWLDVVVRDDGRGIDWEKLRSKATEHGLPSKTHEDLVEALLTDGLSTRSEVTSMSGRGVGMAAVHQAVLELDGEFDVQSSPGSGTTFTFRLPWSRVTKAPREMLQKG